MVGCLALTSDALPGRNTFPSSHGNCKLRFDCRDVLTLLHKCPNFKQLKQIHARIIRNGFSQEQSIVTKMLRLCFSYGEMNYATLVFHQVPSPSTFAWNLMIRAYTISGSSSQALLLYNLMISQGIPPDKFTFPFVVKACLGSASVSKGQEAHALAIKCGFFHDIYVQNTLMDLYLKCGYLDCGRKMFDKMRARNTVSWTTLLGGLASHGELDAAHALLNQMPIRNVVSWTTMINAYARNHQPHKAFELFRRMQLDDVRPNEFTLVSLLIACTELGSLTLGRWVHDFALKNGHPVGAFLGTALIDMYSKCGSLEDAKQVFDNMESKSLATWNSMITSLGVHGHGEEALALFLQLEMTGLQPDAVTFVGVLCACVRMDDVDEGSWYFKYMTERYGIVAIAEHYTCMIELYNRAKMLGEVHKLVDNVPSSVQRQVVAALLSTGKF